MKSLFEAVILVSFRRTMSRGDTRQVLDVIVVTGLTTHSVGGEGQYCFARCRLSLLSVVCNTPQWHSITHQGAACDGGPVMLRPVRAKPCFA